MRETIFRSFLPCVIALLIPIGSYAGDNVDHQKLLSNHYAIERPDGTGPFPTVMMVPGCSGFHADFQKKYYDSVQKRLVELGFVTLRVNSLAARNATNCRGIRPSTGANDIYIASEYLMQQPFVKKGAINIIGWSWGGAAALSALSPAESQELLPVEAVVAYYPACNWVQEWDSEVPVLVLGGSLDNVAPFSRCETLFNSLPKRNKLTVKIYDGVHHAFDNFQLPAEKQYRYGTLGYNESAAKSAWKEVTNFLHK
jgi:dienelactone hydrolase